MPPPFGGFSETKTRTTSIPGQFFGELLPAIDHLGELKVTLYLLWRFDRMEGTFRYLQPVSYTHLTLPTILLV